MINPMDPTYPMREKAASFEDVVTGTSCNQSSFKTKRGSFFFAGPGAKGMGFKAMFKLRESMPQAQALANEYPKQFEVGSTGWVTTRFSAEEPLPEAIWGKWIEESYMITQKVKR